MRERASLGSGAALVGALALASCRATELPRLPEVLVVVDTDLPVPRAAARLRIDLYDANGRWFESRDVSRPTPLDWPVSFGIHTDDPDREALVWVRVRAYPEGAVRDYRGERFVDLGGPLAPSSGSGTPRLVVDGADRTPASEPAPLVTVDSAFGVRVEPGRRGAVRVVLAGACAGTMSRLPAASDEGIDVASAESCVATSGERAPSPVLRADENVTVGATAAGTWGREGPCEGATGPGGDKAGPGAPTGSGDRVCIPSGVFVLGDARLLETPFIPSTPERTVHVSRFWMDRHEVSVGRFREALGRGFIPKPPPVAYEAPITTWDTTTCTWSAAPMNREELPLTCVTWATARAFCAFVGGDLPSEAQWEYAATATGPARETTYPWGDTDPGCTSAVYERLPTYYDDCIARGAGPRPVSDLGSDVSPLGVVGLGGNVTEWTRDAYADYTSACWGKASIHDPVCEIEGASARSLRGGSWGSPLFFVRGAMRQGHKDGTVDFEGFRCAYASP